MLHQLFISHEKEKKSVIGVKKTLMRSVKKSGLETAFMRELVINSLLFLVNLGSSPLQRH